MFLDTNVWIELFTKESKWEFVRDTLKDGRCQTSVISIAEIASWGLVYGKPIEPMIETVREFSDIIPVTESVALLSGYLKREHKLGMADSLILATSRLKGTNLLTKDNDFRGIEGVNLI